MADPQRLPTAIFGSPFGRRLFVMFCIAALLPTAIVFWMTYRTATADALEARRDALREGGKNYALTVYERLQLADRALAVTDVDAVASGGDTHLANYFTAVSVAPATPAQRELAAGGALNRLRLSPEPDSGPTLLRVAGDRLLSGRIDPAFLWDDPGDMSQAMRICMYGGGARLFCGGHPGTELGERLLSARWELFLEAGFGAQPWTAVAVSGPGHGFGHYRGVLVPAAIAVLLLAVLLSSIQIRRVVVPLADLLGRIQGIEGGEARIGRQAGEDGVDLLPRPLGRTRQRQRQEG